MLLQEYYLKSQKEKQQKYMDVTVEMTSLELVMPCVDSKKNMVIQNRIDIQLQMLNMLDYQSTLAKKEQAKLSWEDTSSLNTVMSAQIKLKSSLSIKNSNNTYRDILLPELFEVSFNSQYQLLPNLLFLPKTKVTMEIKDQLIIRMGLKDLALIQNSVSYQLEQLQFYQEAVDRKEILNKEKRNLEQKIQKIEQLEVQPGQILEHSSKMSLDLELKQFYLMLINDSQDSYTPLLSVGVFLLDVKHDQDIIKTSSCVCFQLSCRYYNIYKSRWENILERQKYLLNTLYAPNTSTVSTIQLLVQEQLNLNISSTMIAVLMSGFLDYNKKNESINSRLKRGSTVFVQTSLMTPVDK